MKNNKPMATVNSDTCTKGINRKFLLEIYQLSEVAHYKQPYKKLIIEYSKLWEENSED